MRIQNREKGFTLLEVLITMVIVSIGLLAMAQMLLITMKQNSASEGRMSAMSVAQSALTEATTKIAAPSDCIPSMTLGSLNQPGRGGYQAKVKCMKLKPEQYLLIATVTDKATGKTVTSQLVYTTTQGRTLQ